MHGGNVCQRKGEKEARTFNRVEITWDPLLVAGQSKRDDLCAEADPAMSRGSTAAIQRSASVLKPRLVTMVQSRLYFETVNSASRLPTLGEGEWHHPTKPASEWGRAELEACRVACSRYVCLFRAHSLDNCAGPPLDTNATTTALSLHSRAQRPTPPSRYPLSVR